MRIGACPFEKEVTDLLHRGHWPEACSDELRAHAAACKSCGELILMTRAFRRERAAASAQPRLESAGVLWWRAQLRRRNAALEKMQRPLLGAQVFAVVVALAAAAAFLGTRAKEGLGWLGWLADLPRALHLEVLIPAALQNSAGIALLAVAVLAVIGIAGGFVALTTSEKR
ncbi:MAG TPA: hypothetical protein VKB38_09960 [Terracidiphilus sp.]|nr:hypothetical protein [Terracidiphilus sp.]